MLGENDLQRLPAAERMSVRIGISGWTYAGWRGVFYPAGLSHKRELEYASRMLTSVEVNGTFYRLQRPENFAAWYDATPSGFRFAIKGSRFITHMKQLRDVRTPLANFLASGVLRLEEKLGSRAGSVGWPHRSVARGPGARRCATNRSASGAAQSTGCVRLFR